MIDEPIVYAAKSWLDFVCPPPAPRAAPWERVDPRTPSRPLLQAGKLSLLDRAKLYLTEVDPAVQGSGGHAKLLWAARCLVVGFELDEETALGLLWSDYNPRCSPPWNQASETERKDFERKVGQAKGTPAGKKPGWLLDEFGLRDAATHERARALGETSAAALLESAKKRAHLAPKVEPEPLEEEDGEAPPQPFPIELFPTSIRDYCLMVSESHNVDTSFAALPVLTVAGAAMGNAWRLQAKTAAGDVGGFQITPILWTLLVARHGQNKSGPLAEIHAVLDRPIPVAMVEGLLTPQGRLVVGDATIEALAARLQESPRGLLLFRDEAAGWLKSFGEHKKGPSSDEQTWLQFWNGKPYRVDRKTNNEQVYIPAASVSVLGGIQPKTLAKLFTAERFESGFVPRVLITCPEGRFNYWNEHVIGDHAAIHWEQAITWLRLTPFAAMEPGATVKFVPRVVQIGAEGTPAKAEWVRWDQECVNDMAAMSDENGQGFVAKAKELSGRLALIHHGLTLACRENRNYSESFSVESMQAGVAWARWCLRQQLDAYGFNTEADKAKHAKENTDYLLARMREKGLREANAAAIARLNKRRYEPKQRAVAAMAQLVELGHARWEDETQEKVILNLNGKVKK